MNRRRSLGTLVGLLPLVAGTAWAADPPGTTLSRGALRLCHRAERAAPDDKAALLARSLARADQAVAADARDAIGRMAPSRFDLVVTDVYRPDGRMPGGLGTTGRWPRWPGCSGRRGGTR